MHDATQDSMHDVRRGARGWWCRLAVVAALLGAGASAVTAQTPPARKFVDREWVALWHTTGDPDDALFGVPREIAASEAGLFVLDVGTRQLSAFGRDARKRWTVGKQGRGPGEFLRPLDLALLRNGEIGVLDPDNGRVSIFTANGTYRTSRSSTAASIATRMCATADGRMHFVVSATNAFVISSDTAGKPIRLHAFPWPTDGNPPTMVRSADFARGPANARCTIATTFGFGTAVLEGDQPLRTRAFVESLRLPKIEQKQAGRYIQQTVTEGDNASRGAFHWRDTLFVSFAGSSKNPHLLDLYDRSGAYIESWTPPAGSWYAYADGMLYAIVNSAESPEITAFVAKSDTARILRELRATRRPAPPNAKKRQLGS